MHCIWGATPQIVGCYTIFFGAPAISGALKVGMPTNRVTQVIHIYAQAPAKPAEGRPCNGCGVCCLTQPCPLGMLLSRKRAGACKALRWRGDALRYSCGAVDDSSEWVNRVLPTQLAWLAKPSSKALSWLALRWIAAGAGCDSSLLPLPLAVASVGDNSPASSLPQPQPEHHD